MVISKYRPFPGNIDSLGDRAKKRINNIKQKVIKTTCYIFILQGAIQKFQDFIKNKKLGFFCKHFIGLLRNSPLCTEYNDLHDQEDYRITFLYILYITKN